jgi:hypothetical protein
MAHKPRAYALAAQLLSNAEVAHVVFIRARRPYDRLSAQASQHHAPRVDGAIESEYQQRARNRKAQYRPPIEYGASNCHPASYLADLMSSPTKLPATFKKREAQETLGAPKFAGIEYVIESRGTGTVDQWYRLSNILRRSGTKRQCCKVILRLRHSRP